MSFAPGDTVTVREVWCGRTWLHFPEVVVADAAGPHGDVLATVQADGTPLTFPDHPGGPHPWSGQRHWQGTTVLKLRRPGLWYSVWKFFDVDGRFLHWYVNFERPLTRRDDGIDVDDLELDLVVHPEGNREWKDVEFLRHGWPRAGSLPTTSVGCSPPPRTSWTCSTATTGGGRRGTTGRHRCCLFRADRGCR